MMRRDWATAGSRVAVAVVLAGAAVSMPSSRARAFNPQPEPPGRWGLFGITTGQSARVSVVNISGDPNGYPPGPCRVSLAIVGADGTVLKEARATLRPGQSAAIENGFQPPPEPESGDAVGSSRSRQDLRARTDIVNFNAPPEPERQLFPPGPCVPAVEVFDTATGQTAFMVAEARMGWAPNHNETLVRDTGE